MTIDRDVVGRVREHEIRALALQQVIKSFRQSGIATDESMPVEYPQISRLADGRYRVQHGGSDVLWSTLHGGRGLTRFLQQQIDLSKREAGDLDIKLDVDQRLQLDGEYLTVPAGVERKLVVREHIGLALRRIEVG
jgi:hypothetical protein